MRGYTFRKASDYGWDVYYEGAWVGWSAGSRTDAQEMAADIERERSAS